jgi:hypothetical protein
MFEELPFDTNSYFSSASVRHTWLSMMLMLLPKASRKHCSWSQMMVSIDGT